MENCIKCILVCKDKSEQKPDGVSFSIELENGMIAFDVCYNGNIKNISESIVLNNRILKILTGLSRSIEIAAERKLFTFDGRDPDAMLHTLSGNPYLGDLCEFMGLDKNDPPRRNFEVQIQYYEPENQ